LDGAPYLALLPSGAAISVPVWPKTVILWARADDASRLWVAVLWWFQAVMGCGSGVVFLCWAEA
jgi:hypothetical protein